MSVLPRFLASGRAWIVAGFTAASLLAAWLVPPMPQPVDYHDFADQRTLLGVDNCLDCVTNVGFAIAGLAGFYVLRRRRARFGQPVELVPYVAFFVGVLLTAIGSTYYHLAPDNERLVWDRLPMTIAFMSLIAAQIVERISVRAGLALLGPLVAIGMASVLYWIVTEWAGAGNVVPYAVLQGYAVVALLLITMTHPSRYTHGNDLYWVFAGYVAAKVLEHFDREIYAVGEVISGHSLKHVAAAIAGLLVCRILWRRTLRKAIPAREVSRLRGNVPP
jgi:hypothetical protein